MHSLEPEYPSLTPVDLEEGPGIRLARSKRGFMQDRRKLVDGLSELAAKESWLNEIIGEVGDFSQANTSAVDAWLQAWRMPTAADPRPDVESSRSVFVGIINSREMPYSSSASSNAPHVSISTQFIRTCSRLSEVFPQFAEMLKSNPSLDTVSAYRGVFLFDHLDPATKNQALADEMRARRDVLFSIRTTQAAIRWAIAHEMAHLVMGRSRREAAYKRVATLYPNMEQEQWTTKREHLKSYENPLKRYRDEIACDLLAIDFILASPFAVDDLITQVSGSLVALEAIKWDGWFKDQSAVSGTHPSPTLRFQIVLRAWLEKLTDPETWKDRSSPGELGVDDIAHWVAFDRWSVGGYGHDRNGATWEDDIHAIRGLLLERIPRLAGDQWYAHNGAETFRIRNGQ